MLHSMNHDEYTDYSCSTSLERLARDVETLLRTWHVTGSDRHVSFDHSHNPKKRAHLRRPSLPNEAETLTPPQRIQRATSARAMDSPTIPPPGSPVRSKSSPSRGLSRSMSFASPREEVCSTEETVRLIRSETVTWTVSLASGGKVTVPLILALWDGPSNNTDSLDALPHSLRRLPFTRMPEDFFGNFSSLFGIGQHITLSPQELNDDLTMSLGTSVLQRHRKETAPWVISSILSSSLQTALNVAISNVQSQLPVFGVWGVYSPERQESHLDFLRMQQHDLGLELFPNWMSIRSIKLPPHIGEGRRRLFSKSSLNHWNHLSRNFIPPFLSGDIMPGPDLDSVSATFWVSVLPGHNLAADSQLSVWGQILMRHCPPSTTSVVLCGARHTYIWHKLPTSMFPQTSVLFGNYGDSIQAWRESNSNNDDFMDEPAESVDTYRRQCRRYAEKLLEAASGATRTKPRWGPLDDPISSVHVTTTWNGATNDNNDRVEPLISLPFVVRSRHKMSQSDWAEMEDAVEQTLLDPFDPSIFVVQSLYDKDTSVTSLAASQRCILAALIRTATLPPEILMQHLTNEAVMDGWNSDIGEQAAKELVDLANLHPLTKNLVEAMDWKSIADDMIESREAEQIVENVFDGSLVMGFPSPPEESFVSTDDTLGPFAPFPKSAPPGRLLSLLFLNMSRLHAPSSMALVWKKFVSELRVRWDTREALPNMSYVPGLDPSPEQLKVLQCVTTLGLKANLSASVNSSEPDPDETNCLIGQKLQVFNIGIESSVALEIQEIEKMERRHREEIEEEVVFVADKNEDQCAAASVASTDITHNVTSKRFERNTEKTLPVVDSLPNKRSYGAIAESPEEEQHSRSRDSTSKDEYHDANEGRSILGSIGTDEGSVTERMDYTTSVTQRQSRRGARCPVQGVSLVASGDQLYAPYLQRSDPVTDDVILERRMMLSNARSPTSKKKKKIKVSDRIEIAHRLQKPKLLSDMRAFRAANPGAVFTDFVNWYGNPGNPLDDYADKTCDTKGVDGQSLDPRRFSTAVKLDNASEAIQILTAMRDFWSATWDEATPCPAAEQDPLFDSSTTVEMLLDSLETMHPASLVNQILAVNLSLAYFTLMASAGDTLHIGMVSSSLKDLRSATEHALLLLSRDVTHGTSSRLSVPEDHLERLPRHASLEAIRACDTACNALSLAEASIVRAMSILHKFPRQYDLAQNMLRRADGEPIALESPQGRSDILHAIQKQQDTITTHPVPSLREYILRNTDDENPCQLCVRFGQEGDLEGAKDKDGVAMLALTKSYRD